MLKLIFAGEAKHNFNKGSFYSSPVATCSRKQAFLIIIAILVTLLTCSLIIAFVRPGNQCDHNEDVNSLDNEVDQATPEPIATNGDPFPWNDVRLPKSIIPLRYNLVLHPNMTTLFLRGQMEVLFTVVQETNYIVLHGKNISLTLLMIRDRNERELLTSQILYYPYNQQIYIGLKNYLKQGSNYSLALRYEGKVQTDMEGLYLSSYTNPKGIKQ